MTKHSKVVRGAVLLSSGSVAALLVFQGVPGCDRPVEPKVEAKAEPKAEPKPGTTAEVRPVEPKPVEAKTAEAKVEPPPVEAKVEPPPVEAKADPKKGESGLNNANAAPRYFPASKAGVFIEPAPPAPQTPQQQAGAK